MKMHLIKTNDDVMYHVIHQEPEAKDIDVEKTRIKHQCTNVFRKDGIYWFVRLVEEAQVIEENLEN